MTKPTAEMPLLIHALSARIEDDSRLCRIRATVRAGQPAEGQVVHFEGLDRVRRELTIERSRETPHLYTIWLAGAEEDLKLLVPGTYLHG